MVLGEAYTAVLPFVTSVPVEGVDHVTPILVLPVTDAVIACVFDWVSDALDGLVETATGFKLTLTVADLVGSAALVAVTATFWALGIRAGVV